MPCGGPVGIFGKQEGVAAAVDVGNIHAAVGADEAVAGFGDEHAALAADDPLGSRAERLR